MGGGRKQMRDLDTKMTYTSSTVIMEKNMKSFYFRKIGNEVTCWVGGKGRRH